MNYPVELLEKIDRYLDGHLSEDECRTIELRMIEDNGFRDLVHAMKQTKVHIEEAELALLARQVVKRLDLEQAVADKTTVPVRRIGLGNRFWVKAASIAAVVLLANGAFLTLNTVDLANADISPKVHRLALETTPDGLRPDEREALNNFILANELFVNGDYEEAIPYYKQTAGANVSDYLKECTWWNPSHAYLKLGKVEEARHYFNLYNNLAKPHFQSSFMSQLRLKAQLMWADLFS